MEIKNAFEYAKIVHMSARGYHSDFRVAARGNYIRTKGSGLCNSAKCVSAFKKAVQYKIAA